MQHIALLGMMAGALLAVLTAYVVSILKQRVPAYAGVSVLACSSLGLSLFFLAAFSPSMPVASPEDFFAGLCGFLFGACVTPFIFRPIEMRLGLWCDSFCSYSAALVALMMVGASVSSMTLLSDGSEELGLCVNFVYLPLVLSGVMVVALLLRPFIALKLPRLEYYFVAIFTCVVVGTCVYVFMPEVFFSQGALVAYQHLGLLAAIAVGVLLGLMVTQQPPLVMMALFGGSLLLAQQYAGFYGIALMALALFTGLRQAQHLGFSYLTTLSSSLALFVVYQICLAAAFGKIVPEIMFDVSRPSLLVAMLAGSIGPLFITSRWSVFAFSLLGPLLAAMCDRTGLLLGAFLAGIVLASAMRFMNKAEDPGVSGICLKLSAATALVIMPLMIRYGLQL